LRTPPRRVKFDRLPTDIRPPGAVFPATRAARHKLPGDAAAESRRPAPPYALAQALLRSHPKQGERVVSVSSVLVSVGLAQQLQKQAQSSATAKTAATGIAAQADAVQQAGNAHHRRHHAATQSSGTSQAAPSASGGSTRLNMFA